jgi:hypothetical protein
VRRIQQEVVEVVTCHQQNFIRGRTDLHSKVLQLGQRLLSAVSDPEHIQLHSISKPTMTESDPDRGAMPPPASPASRNRSSRPISSNQTESSSSAIGKSTSSGQGRVSLAMSDTSSDYPKSDQFSVATKLEIKRMSGHRCWACNTLRPQVAHVVGKEDQQVGSCVFTIFHRMWIT